MSATETSTKPLHKLLDKLSADFAEWVKASRQSLEIVWNKDLDRFRDSNREFQIKWIVVGHNPGRQERGTCNAAGLWMGRYFHPDGSTGSWTRLILAHDVESLEDEVLFLEKTPICSDDLPGLNRRKKDRLFKEMQERMAKAVYDLQEATGASVWIQGASPPADDPLVSFSLELSRLYDTPAAARARKERVFKTHHLGRLMRNGRGFPVESLLDEGLAKALPKLEGFENLK